MLGPYENEEEILEAMLYWQKYAFETKKRIKYLETNVEVLRELYHEEGANVEVLRELLAQVDKEREYWIQQFLDKQKELEILLSNKSKLSDGGTEESDDPWKYRS